MDMLNNFRNDSSTSYTLSNRIVAFHDWGYEAGPPSHYPIRECIASTGIIPEIIQHSHFGIAILRVPYESE